MATVLITGKTSLFTQEVLERIAAYNTIVLAGKDLPVKEKVSNIYTYDTIPTEDSFPQLFDVYSFNAVWYVSGYADGGSGAFGEMQMLECALEQSAKSKVDKFVLLSSGWTQNYTVSYSAAEMRAQREYPDSGDFNAAQAESLGWFYAKKTGMKVITLWLPYIVDRLNDTNFLGQIFRKMCRKEKVILPHTREDRLEMLSSLDLTDLLLQITDETDDATGSYFVVSGYMHTYGDLEEAIRQTVPETTVEYAGEPSAVRWPEYPTQLRHRYGFVPIIDVTEQIGDYYSAFVDEVYEKSEKPVRRLLRRISQGIFKYFELIVFFLLTEFIARYTSNSVYFRFVDVRLAYIVIMGTVHGIRIGIFAAILEAIVLVIQYIRMGISGTLLFYNIENWIPFVVYLMAGSIPGYIRDKATEDLAFARKEYELLRNKYLFLNDAYHGAIRNKGEYKRQILGFKDSFGKIFEAVQKLDSELPQRIFLEGLQVMENILENHTVAIYTVDSWQRFGRMVACSGIMRTRLMVSIRLEDYREMYETVKAGNVWRNVELTPNVPMYASGVFNHGRVVLMVVLWEATAEQYGNYYTNIFQILCGLVQTSFLRALEYEQLRFDQTTVAGTRVLNAERMEQIVAVEEEMQNAGAANYMLLRFKETDPIRISEELTGLVRASDTLGEGPDGKMYLLLTQITGKTFHFVGERLDEKGIQYEIVDKVGA